MTDLEDQMRRSLERRVHGLDDAPLTLGDVRGRAGSIRRRRRLTAATVGAVAVVALAVPFGLGLGGDDRSAPEPAVDPTSSVLPDTPQVGYLEGATYHYPDGRTVELPADDYSQVAQLGDDVVAYRRDASGGGDVDLVSSGGEEVRSVAATGRFATDDTGRAVAFADASGQLVVWSDGRTDVLATTADDDLPPEPYVADLAGPDCDVVGPDCRVYVGPGVGGSGPVVLSRSDDATSVEAGADRHLYDADDEGAITVDSSELGPEGACGTVVDPDTGDDRFDTCTHTLKRFSPGSAFVSAAPDYEAGLGNPWVAVVDATDGSELGRYTPGGDGVVVSSVWEDDTHLLAAVFADGAWSVVRLGVDGSSATVTDPVPGDAPSDGTVPGVVLAGPTG